MEIIKNDFRPINVISTASKFSTIPQDDTRGPLGSEEHIKMNSIKKKSFLKFDWLCSSSMTIFSKIILTSDVFIFILANWILFSSQKETQGMLLQDSRRVC
jgi:hypothetical protein